MPKFYDEVGKSGNFPAAQDPDSSYPFSLEPQSLIFVPTTQALLLQQGPLAKLMERLAQIEEPTRSQLLVIFDAQAQTVASAAALKKTRLPTEVISPSLKRLIDDL